MLATVLFISVLGASRIGTQAPAQAQKILNLDFGQKGVVTILLHTSEAPKACAHIEDLVGKHFYDHQKVFRTIRTPKPYIVQMGDPYTIASMKDPRIGSGGSGTSVPFESTSFHMVEGAVALATLPAKPNSGDSQFFIVLGDYSHLLDGTATIFGQVQTGMNIVNTLSVGDEIVSAKITDSK